jgi:hypothetical protein
MADQIRATPRNSLAALLSDAINSGVGYMKSPQRTQQLQGLGRLIESTGIPYTVESLSYDPSGRGLFTGAGGLGGTTRMRPEALEAAMTVAPMVGPTARLANRGLMATGRAGERVAERVVPQIMERGGLPAEIMQGMSRGTVSPLDVYHGSPYRFPPTARNPLGEFDASKIGTGEGAQAYGYGIYTAEAPVVAKEYQLAEATYKTLHGGLTNKQEFVADMLSQGRPEMSILDLYAQKYGGSFDDAMKDLIDVKEIYKKSGNLYKADLPDEKIGKMLDWDAPLSKQPENVQNWLKDTYNPYKSQLSAKDVGGNEPTGSLIYNRLQELMSEGKKSDAFTNQANFGAVNASKEMADFGIPGIKYLDEGSRAKGEGTRNFVVFPGEEKSMRILERNGETAANPFYSDPFGNTIPDTTR